MAFADSQQASAANPDKICSDVLGWLHGLVGYLQTISLLSDLLVDQNIPNLGIYSSKII